MTDLYVKGISAPQPQEQRSQPATLLPESALDTTKRVMFPKFAFASVTMLIVSTNALFFVMMKVATLFTMYSYDCILYKTGALYPPDLSSLQIYRLIIPVFLHFDLWHVVVNSVFTLLLGFEVEHILGKMDFLTLYFASSLYGFLFSSVGRPNTLSTGASAAVMGLFAFYTARIFVKRAIFDPRSYGVLAFLLMYNVLLFVYPRNANLFAHLGGAFLGATYAILKDKATPQEVTGIARIKFYARAALIVFPVLMIMLYLVVPKTAIPVCATSYQG